MLIFDVLDFMAELDCEKVFRKLHIIDFIALLSRCHFFGLIVKTLFLCSHFSWIMGKTIVILFLCTKFL